MSTQIIIDKFGSAARLARAIGIENQSIVQYWKRAGHIPAKHHQRILDASDAAGLGVVPTDFLTVEHRK